MKIKELIDLNICETINAGQLETEITKPFCCDLLSIAMSKAPAGCAWVTVMGNINTLAVAALTEVACIVLAEGTNLDEQALEKARMQDITVLRTDMPIFEMAMKIQDKLTEQS
ncbi:MAG: hypothetical protein ACI4DS_08215 [Eubacterium sp.]